MHFSFLPGMKMKWQGGGAASLRPLGGQKLWTEESESRVPVAPWSYHPCHGLSYC